MTTATASWSGIVLWAAVAAACAGAGSDAPPTSQVQIAQAGETLVVKNIGVDGGEEAALTRDWGLGVATGARHEELGRWMGVHATSDGGAVLSERTPTRVRLFDSLGTQVRSYGRPGSGPGEYMAPNAAILDPRGFLFLRHFPFRVNVYDPAGTFVREWTTPPSPGWQWHIDAQGLVSQLTQDLQTDLYTVIVTDGKGAVVDTIPVPATFGDSLTVRHRGRLPPPQPAGACVTMARPRAPWRYGSSRLSSTFTIQAGCSGIAFDCRRERSLLPHTGDTCLCCRGTSSM